MTKARERRRGEVWWFQLAGWACLTVSACTGLSVQAITGPVGHIRISICVLWLTAYHMLTDAVAAELQRLRVWLQLQHLSPSMQATFSLQRTLYCCWSNNRNCKSYKKRDPTSYERFNRMSALTTSVITRLQFIFITFNFELQIARGFCRKTVCMDVNFLDGLDLVLIFLNPNRISVFHKPVICLQHGATVYVINNIDRVALKQMIMCWCQMWHACYCLHYFILVKIQVILLYSIADQTELFRLTLVLDQTLVLTPV